MASFVDNIVDKDEVAIDCKYIGFHYDTGNTSDEHTTENQQASFDNNDADWDDDGVPFAEGDVVLLHMYTDDACAVVKIVSDGGDTYTPDVQLLGPQVPSVTLRIIEGEAGNEYTASSTSSDEYQWDYNGETMYHKAEWYGKTLCDSVGITKVEYDFGDGYSEDSKYTWSDAGDKVVKVRVTNKAGLTAEDEGVISIKWGIPSTVVTHSPDNIEPGDDIVATITNTDPDSVIVQQTYTIDGKDCGTTFSVDLTGTHVYKVVTVWNDGYDDHEYTTEHIIEVDNKAPTINMIAVSSGNNDEVWALSSNAEDPEGMLDYVRLVVYMDSNYTFNGIDEVETNWQVIRDERLDGLSAEVHYHTSGRYKVEMSAVDEGGLWSTTNSKEMVVACTDVIQEIVHEVVYDTGNKVFVEINNLLTGTVDVIEMTASIDDDGELTGDVSTEILSGDIIDD